MKCFICHLYTYTRCGYKILCRAESQGQINIDRKNMSSSFRERCGMRKPLSFRDVLHVEMCIAPTKLDCVCVCPYFVSPFRNTVAGKELLWKRAVCISSDSARLRLDVQRRL